MINFRDKAIRTIHASVATVVYDGGVTTATDTSGNAVTLDESAIATEVARLEAAWTATDYTRTRATAYPSIGDQLDMLWHAVDTGDWTAAKVKTTEFYTALKAVKDANPKP